MIQLAAIIREFAAMQRLDMHLFDVCSTRDESQECLILSCAELMKYFPNPWPHPFMQILKVSHLFIRRLYKSMISDKLSNPSSTAHLCNTVKF